MKRNLINVRTQNAEKETSVEEKHNVNDSVVVLSRKIDKFAI